MLLLTSLKAELNNKVIITVGDEIITNYDLTREIKYLSAITIGKFKSLKKKESKKIAIDSLIKDKIKINALANYSNISMSDKIINNQIVKSSRNIGFKSFEDFERYLQFAEYDFDEFRKKILLELKWNQLVYQFYKNQITIDKEKIDKKLKKFIADQKPVEEYLLYEIFIKNSALKELNKESEDKLEESDDVKKLAENKTVNEKQTGIIIEAEIASYNNEKNLTNEEISIEKSFETKTNDQITINDLLKSIKEKGFENTATQFSSSPTAQQGGKLGWVSETKFSKLLLKFVKKTKVGSVTEPISIPEGILILKVKDKRVEKSEIDLEEKMQEIIENEKNDQLNNFSTNYFNQIKNNTKIKYFND